MKYISKSEIDTMNWAKKIAKGFVGGETIALNGNLGAGKTVVSKGIALGLGVSHIVNSPTFVLMKVYPVKSDKKKKIKHFVHVDAYRLSSFDELLAIGLQDYIDDKSSVVVIEWADKVKKILPKQTKYIKIDNNDQKSRVINY